VDSNFSRILRTFLHWLKESLPCSEREGDTHGFLLSAHGLYTWGEDVAQAHRHVEIFEFLLETVGRREFAGVFGAEK